MTKSLYPYILLVVKATAILYFTFPVYGIVNSDFTGFSEKAVPFNKIIYNAARQNWSVSAAPNGFIYFANHQGLLEFDGANWQLYKLPNETILRTVKVLSDSLIYTSGYMELGYWKPDKFGKLNYFSISDKAKEQFSKNIEFWNITVVDDFVYFQSFNKALSYHNNSVSLVSLPASISVMSKVHDKVLVASRDSGIYEIEQGVAKPFLLGDFFRSKLIQFLIPYKNNQLLIGTASHGMFLWNGEEITSWNSQWTDYLIKNELNRGFYSKNGQIVVGTIIDGIVVFDENGSLVRKINTKNGLPNNTVLGIESDEFQNLWLALDDGIGFIPFGGNNGFSIENIPGVGAIYSMAVINNSMYLGTNQGLFMKPLKDDTKNFELVPETQAQIWECKIIEGKLWVGHNQGTFAIEGNSAKQISSKSGGFSIRSDINHPDLLIQSTYNDLVVYKRFGDTFKYNNLISGFSDLIRYIEIDHLDNIWASHLHRGIYKITTNDNRDSVTSVRYYDENTFKKNLAVNVFKVENRIVITDGEQIFTYDDLKDSIISHTTLNKELGQFAASQRIVEGPNHHYWFISKKSIGLFSINQDSVKLIKEFPVTLFKNQALVDGFENIFPLTEKSAYLCLQNGIAKLDASVQNESSAIENYTPILRQFDLSSSTNNIIQLNLNDDEYSVKNKFHNIYFRFSFPYISELPVLYSYQLEGLSYFWSEPSNSPNFRFERLPKGDYTLRVKTIDLWGNESKEFSCSFTVLPAWYTSTPAIIFYVVLLIVVLLLFRRWGIRMTKRKEKQQHLEREKELIKIRNEKLRDEIEHKSKELASSTMSIIKKNEFLMEMKDIIDKQKVELGSRYPDKYYNYLHKKIDENISNQDDWQIFENNFERAHDKFFTKMKTNYPDLTSSDLRLCAYLHMNLSSKEIAPLLGISVRGVENHRYRLRKKMNLEHDENLVEIINGH
jgi:DNA-binding CsgD family transcriptional regulator